ncbi:MAG: FAD-binding oxidoreductase [Microbacterium sp.]
MSQSPEKVRRVLPPDVEEADFDAALAEFRRILGDENVVDDPEGVAPYRDAFPVTGEDTYTPGAVVFPGSTEEVQEIVRVANRYLIPLHAISTGKNLGYGGASPRTRGTVVVHLGKRMNHILEVNEKYGYALLEPGVTFTDLHAHITAHGYNLQIDAPDLAWGSVVGNAMERGVGYTPYGNHAAWRSGLEIVLPDGEVLRTGSGGLPVGGASTWQLNPAGFGPHIDGLFEQSNFGIVTKMGIQLMQPAPFAETFLITFENAEDLPAIIDTMFPLRVNMAPLQNIAVLRNILLDAGQTSTRADWYRGDGPIPDDVIDRMKRELDLGYWNFYATCYGPPPVVEQYLGIIRDAFLQIPGARFFTTKDRPLSESDPGAHTLHDRHKINTGVPTTAEAAILDWVPNGGHLGFSPISAPDGEDAYRQFLDVKRTSDRFNKDYAAQFVIGLRELHHIALLLFDTTDERARAETLELTRTLITEGAAKGYGEYRGHNAVADLIASTYSWGDNIQRRLNERLKDALDPNGILNPGKAGIWPARLRGRDL